MEYSIETKKLVEEIAEYYEDNDTFEFLKKIIKFFEEILDEHILEKLHLQEKQ
jgi:hypothetical protein